MITQFLSFDTGIINILQIILPAISKAPIKLNRLSCYVREFY
ncbi:hypothetical protein PMAN_a1100 [Pseudoalteromonas marina]|nr:hypothetical protein PMAN_a1100 [Pseudoalteromonas marina]GAA75474.1 hypothetical protein P20480_1942 [Pseudoalteromonas sp. BSi20480]